MGKIKTVDFSETIAACDLKVGRFLYHIFSRFYALLGQEGERLQDHWSSGLVML